MMHILTYHRIAEPRDTPTLNPRLISATPTTFAQHIHHLARHYSVVSLEDVFHAVTTGASLPKRSVLLTFDDAYRDFGDIAWPILKRYRLPATLFVPTAYPAQPQRGFWWDRLYHAVMHTTYTELPHSLLGALPLGNPVQRSASLRSLQTYLKTLPHVAVTEQVDALCDELDVSPIGQRSVLNWDELRHLAGEGVTLAAHTQTHAILTQLSSEQIHLEIQGSQEDLQREIGTTLPIFCYPNGSHDERVVSLLQAAGFVMAFATAGGVPLPKPDALDAQVLLRIRRTNITRRTSPLIFRLRLTWLGAALDRWRHRKKTFTSPAGIHSCDSLGSIHTGTVRTDIQ